MKKPLSHPKQRPNPKAMVLKEYFMVLRDQAPAASAQALHAEDWSNRKICFTQKG